MVNKILPIILKVGLAILLLYALYHYGLLDLEVIYTLSFDSRTVMLMLTTLLLILFVVIIVSVRIWYLLSLIDFKLTLLEVTKVNLSSMCLGLTLPGMVGTDAIRATYFCLRERDRKIDVFTAMVVDRLAGIFALLTISSVAVIVDRVSGLGVVKEIYMLPILAIFLSTTFVFIFLASGLFQSSRLFSSIYNILPNFVQLIASALRTYIASPKGVLVCLGLSMMSQAATITSFVVVGMILKDNLPTLAHYVINPMALCFNAIPLTPGGIGFTESAFAFLYSTAGSDNGAVISLLGRLNQSLVYVLVGVPALFFLDWTVLKKVEDESRANLE